MVERWRAYGFSTALFSALVRESAKDLVILRTL
ncbi:hypothetical protein IX336_000332 [Porphyromonas levii]|nr:hypothetical protein [Porphyromonas levii]